MHATALICDEAQRFSLESVQLPDPAPDQVVVKTHYSGVSIGTELALIRNKISWGPYPLCTGYMGAGVVEFVGADVDTVKVGERVYFRGSDGLTLSGGRAVSAVCGTHCSHIVRRANASHGVAVLPDGVGLDVASLFVMPAVGLAGVDQANPRLGDVVVVNGVGLIGLGVVAACVQRGCVVIAVDINAKALNMAREFGADYLVDAARQDVPAEVRRVAPDGADVVFEASGLPGCVDAAIELCRVEGAFVWQGNYGSAPIPFKFLPPHGRRLRMFFPCDDGLQACRRAVLRNMALKSLPWERTITHRVECAESPALFDRINRGDRDIIGAVIHWGS